MKWGKQMGQTARVTVAVILAVAVMLLCIGAGSVSIPWGDILSIVVHKLFGRPLPEHISASVVPIIWEIRMPRVFTAFAAGLMLSVSGALMQALLQNPLASSYTLGVSSGASLGAAIVIVSEVTIPVIGGFLLPGAGFLFGLGTVVLVLFFSSRLDENLRNHTIILFGMIFSLFVNACVTMLSALSSQHMQRLTLWLMGSFAGRRWEHAAILYPVALIGSLLVFRYHRELDLMSFGEEAASAVGVDTTTKKKLLLVLAALLTGGSVCFTGVIGFIDLAAPHAARRIFGSSHRYVIPMSGLLGGSFMVLADLVSRTLLSPQEIPVGAVTALLGAPFFLWVYFGTKRR